jgi:mannobiose 2-epimerase
MDYDVTDFRKELEHELTRILGYWMQHTIDEQHGGFYGKIDHRNTIVPGAAKGSVLNSRILYTFASAYIHIKDSKYLAVAGRAFDYILAHFIDSVNGGVYWTVDEQGKPLDTKKQVYALAFAVYGMSEYYRACRNEKAKETAIALYHDIVGHSYDVMHGGYIEALTADWQEIKDLRLSTKDANEKKSMNTHLHVLEAFANLYRIWPDAQLKKRIVELIHLFQEQLIDSETHHLVLFFDAQWNKRSALVSYGHDIEAAWLVQEAAEVIGEVALTALIKARSVQMATVALEAADEDGGLWYEFEPAGNHLIKEKHWWPQAEAMVGFFNAWQLTGDQHFLQRSIGSWRFVQQYIIDRENGEWYWGVYEDHSVMQQEDKAGLWKCPYHNGRACIELIRRIQLL